MHSFAEKVISFNKTIQLDVELPEGIRMMNPFVENLFAMELSSAFYRKFYNDYNKRRLILGINPGRFGAGVTGIPFTDTKRLEKYCGLQIPGIVTHEPSSVFIYEVIEAYGGPDKFYSDFYINSPSPLGFVKKGGNGKELNFNYYDSPELQDILNDFMTTAIHSHISIGINTDAAFCLGTGKNYKYLYQLNESHNFFNTLTPLEHPRYIMQYKSKEKLRYIQKYIDALTATF